MKLYATTSSERATKGQGGQWLDIKITDKDKKTLLDMRLEYENEKLKAVVYTSTRCISKEFSDMYTSKPLFSEVKGKQQKGETCKICDGLLSDTGSMQCALIHQKY